MFTQQDMDTQKPRFISLQFKLYDEADGTLTLLEESDDSRPMAFVSGLGIILDRIERGVASLAAGEAFDITLTKEDAYGDYDPSLVTDYAKEEFYVDGAFDNKRVYPGAILPMLTEDDEKCYARVVSVDPEKVTLDLNHPYAGKTLRFIGRMEENRDATEEEIQGAIKLVTGEKCCGGHECHCGGHEQGGDNCCGGECGQHKDRCGHHKDGCKHK